MTRVALISLEPWDLIWRRNQHLVSQLVQQGLIGSLDFIDPPTRTPRSDVPDDLPCGITVIRPRLILPKRAGGLILVARQLKRRLSDADLVWINDPALGVHCLSAKQPAVYDITDDWRSYDFPPRITRRIVRAEDQLALSAATIVCSPVLRDRWQQRYGLDAALVPNGVDVDAWQNVEPRVVLGTGPHVGYIGTVQPERLDVDLVVAVADAEGVGTVHLVGPDALDDDSRRRLVTHPKIMLHGPVPARDVPSWTAAMDVLICPHRLTPFTLSLDAIKSREYLISGRPIVATPTSGFQNLRPGADQSVNICGSENFVTAVTALVNDQKPVARDLMGLSWAARAKEFASSWPSRPAAT